MILGKPESFSRPISAPLLTLIIPLSLCRIPAGYMHTPATGHNTCRVPAYPCHWSGYLQGTCIPLPLVRMPAGYMHTPATGQDTCRVPAYPCHWSGYLHTPATGQVRKKK